MRMAGLLSVPYSQPRIVLNISTGRASVSSPVCPLPGVSGIRRRGLAQPLLTWRWLGMPDGHRHPRAHGTCRLRHRVLPLGLAAAAHDDQVAVAGLEPVGRDRRAAAAEQEPPPRAERDRRDEG